MTIMTIQPMPDSRLLLTCPRRLPHWRLSRSNLYDCSLRPCRWRVSTLPAMFRRGALETMSAGLLDQEASLIPRAFVTG